MIPLGNHKIGHVNANVNVSLHTMNLPMERNGKGNSKLCQWKWYAYDIHLYISLNIFNSIKTFNRIQFTLYTVDTLSYQKERFESIIEYKQIHYQMANPLPNGTFTYVICEHLNVHSFVYILLWFNCVQFKIIFKVS